MRESLSEGLTLRAVLAIIFASTILMPVTIWMQLIGGQAAGLAFTTILLFIFVTKYFGRSTLSPQEIILINIGVGIAAYTPIFTTFIYRAYFAGSPEAHMFSITDFLPSWYVPHNDLIRKQIIRTLLHVDWIFPMAVVLITAVLLHIPMQLFLSFIMYQVYVIEEKLAFPLARAEAETAIALGEWEPVKMRFMILGFVITFTYSIIAYGPYILGPCLGGVRSIIPVPFIDFTPHTERLLPGALIGLATDPFTFFSGFIVPSTAVISIFIGSITIWIIGNAVGISYFKDAFLPEWIPGFSLTLTYQRSFLRTWASVMIGFSFALALLQLIEARRSIVRAFLSLKRVKGPKGMQWLLLIFYFACATIWVFLAHQLLPEFPVIPLIFLVAIWPFISSIINTRAVGETGYSISLLPVRELTLVTVLSAERVPVYSNVGVGAWFIPLPSTVGGYPSAESWVGYFYTANYVGVSLREVIKAVILIAVPLSLVMSFIYTNIVWAFGPIPSQAYPWASISWPISVIQSSVWITRSAAVFKSTLLNPGTPPLLEGAFVSIILAHALLKALHIGFSTTAFVVGAGTLPPYAITMLIGYLTYRLLCAKYHKESVDKYKWSFYAGVFVGYGSATAVLITLSIGLKAMWMLPY